MSRNLLTKLTLTFIILLPYSLFSQGANPLSPQQASKPYYFGPVVGYNAVSHSAGGDGLQVIDLQDVQGCPNFSEGNANGYYVGVAFEYLLGGAKNSTSSIITKLLYSTMPAFLEQQGQTLPASLNVQGEGTTEPTFTTINFENEIDYSVLSFEALYKLNIGGTPIGIVAGLAFDFTLNATESGKMTLIDPENGRFIEADLANDPATQDWSYQDPKTLLLDPADGSDFRNGNAAGFRAGLKVGVQYEFSFPGFLIVPHMFWNQGLTSLNTDGEAWRVSAFQIGTDVRFAF
jgi:hypothetical protein